MKEILLDKIKKADLGEIAFSLLFICIGFMIITAISLSVIISISDLFLGACK